MRRSVAMMSDATASPFHVHVGAGKLGLSLVVPAVSRSGIPFCVVDRPAPEWDPVLGQVKGPVTFNVNGEDKCTLNLVTGLTEDMDSVDSALVLADDTETLKYFYSKATSMSCSLGPGLVPVMTRIFQNYRDEGSPPAVIYCCENNHDAVMSLSEELKGTATVVDCMVDRISLTKDVFEGKVLVTAEEWPGSIVVLDAPVVDSFPFKSGAANEIVVARDSAASAYMSERKLLLVNGMHTTLAFVTMREAGLEEPAELILDKYPAMGPHLQREVWLWALSRIAILIHNHGLDTIMEVHGLKSEAEVYAELVNYAEIALARFASADDAVARVLGGGVANRWKGRLLSVLTELKSVEDAGLDTPAMRFLVQSKVTPDELHALLPSLAAQGQYACVVDAGTLAECELPCLELPNFIFSEGSCSIPDDAPAFAVPVGVPAAV